MYYGCKREEQDAATRAYIKAYRDAAALYPQIKKVIRSFDRKVYNKRLESAIQNETGARVYIENKIGFIDVHIFGPHNSWITLARMTKDDFIDGKRIDAEKLIQSLTENRERLLKTAALYDRQITEIDQVKEQIDQLRKQFEAVLAPYDYTIRDIYGINKRIN